MTSVPSFLVRLSLDLHAATPDIRRAYARELKLIDQAKDAAGFQSLREAYAAALRWAGPGPSVALKAEAVEVAADPDPAPLVDPHALACAAFADFASAFALVAEGADQPGLEQCQAVLASALNQPALDNISARQLFEQHVAQLLAGGWRPGHEALLGAACHAFDWGGDRRRLAGFGAEGALLARAIDERAMLDAQSPEALAAQCQVLASLPLDSEPDTGDLLRGLHALDTLEQRFPAWMALVASPQHIERWRALGRQVPEWRRILVFESEPAQSQPASRGTRASGVGTAFAILIVLVNLVRLVLGAMPSAPPQADAPAPHAEVREQGAAGRSLPAVSAQSSNPPLDKEMSAIFSDMNYEPPQVYRGELRVAYSIELGPDGRVRNVGVVQHSDDLGYDAAGAAALRLAAPFPATAPRLFFWYHLRPAAPG